MSANPYEAPKTAVADYEAAQEFQEVKIWSASGRIGRLRYMAYGTGGWLVAGLVFGIFAAILDQSLAMLLELAVRHRRGSCPSSRKRCSGK